MSFKIQNMPIDQTNTHAGRSGLVVARLMPAAREEPGSNRAAD